MISSTYADSKDALRAKTRFVPGFPVEGVVFEDLTPVLADAAAFSLLVEDLAQAAKSYDADMIGGLGRATARTGRSFAGVCRPGVAAGGTLKSRDQ